MKKSVFSWLFLWLLITRSVKRYRLEMTWVVVGPGSVFLEPDWPFQYAEPLVLLHLSILDTPCSLSRQLVLKVFALSAVAALLMTVHLLRSDMSCNFS